MSVPPQTVVELLSGSSSTIVDGEGNARTTAELLEAGRGLAKRLAQAGVGPGDRVAVQMDNFPEYLDLLAAAAIHRFVIMSVNVRFSPPLAESLISRSGARLVLRDPADVAALPAVSVSSVPTSPEPESALTRSPEPESALTRSPEPESVSPDDRYVIFTTSGTTSAPKLVVHGQRSIAHHAAEVAPHFGYTADSTVLIPLPLCGTFALATFMGAVAGDATVIVPERFQLDQTAALVREHAVTSLHAPDDLFQRLLNTDADLTSITTAGYGRFNSSLDGIVERAAARGLPLSGLYGMSEVQALFSFRQPSEPAETRWLAGGTLTSPTAAYRVVDGELQVKGPSLFEGYLRDGGDELDQDLTAAHHDDGWFRTGDLAEAEGPRSFRFITRLGDTMRLGGFLVAPTEIETALLELNGVTEAQVVAVDLPTGARPVAFVIPTPGALVDESAAIEHCRRRLATFKAPVRVIPVSEFPVTDGPNGVKIQRAKLRTMAADLLA